MLLESPEILGLFCSFNPCLQLRRKVIMVCQLFLRWNLLFWPRPLLSAGRSDFRVMPHWALIVDQHGFDPPPLYRLSHEDGSPVSCCASISIVASAVSALFLTFQTTRLPLSCTSICARCSVLRVWFLTNPSNLHEPIPHTVYEFLQRSRVFL